VIDLLDTATLQLDVKRDAARASISRASSLQRGDTQRESPKPNSLFLWQIRRVQEHIAANLSGRILVSDLSALARRSEAHFSRAFKSTFGISPHAYVMRKRVERARQMMAVGDDSISNIALACGMYDQAHLTNRFRQMSGQTPAQWRREWRAFSTHETPTPKSSVVAA
jgi:AraC family transcriptional regulator